MDRWERRQLRRLVASMSYHLALCLILGIVFGAAFWMPPREPMVMVITGTVALLCPVGITLSVLHLVEIARELRSRMRR